MTQLGELRDAHARFTEHGIKLYAISYDDPEVLAEFTRVHEIPYPLLSDIDSEVIRAYGILNEEARFSGPLAGIPYPGTYVTDEDGVVVAKFFHDSYKKRDSAQNLIDAALGRIVLEPDEPRAEALGEQVLVSASFHGGPIKQGAMRRVVVRFEVPEGLHIYGEPVPEGMVPTRVRVKGPEGLVVEPTIAPPTDRLDLPGIDVALPVWSGSVDLQVPVHALSTLASECRPLDERSVPLEVEVRYQACDDRTCLLPVTETLHLEVPVQEVDVPAIPLHMGHGQREADFDGVPHMRRLVRRKLRQSPLGFLRFVANSLSLELGALGRRLGRRLG